jgi:hypothetical protein
MGTLKYGTGDYEFDDRVLAHLRVVIAQKLRRRESFLLSWDHHAHNGGGRSSLWITDGVNLGFTFFGSRAANLDRDWLDRMMSASHSVMGLNLEEVPETRAGDESGAGGARKAAARSGRSPEGAAS